MGGKLLQAPGESDEGLNSGAQDIEWGSAARRTGKRCGENFKAGEAPARCHVGTVSPVFLVTETMC